MFGLSLIAAPVSPLKDEVKPLSPCPYSPHPMNRRKVRIDRLASSSGCKHHTSSKSGSSTRSLPSLVFSDVDDADSGDESDADNVNARADSDALTVANLKMLSVDKYGTKDFDSMKSHYITAPSEAAVRLEIRRGLMLVKKVPRHSPLFGMVMKHDIISTINSVDMNGKTVSHADRLLRNSKRQNHLLIYRIHCDAREEIVSPDSSVASIEEEDSIDISGSLHVCCRKGDLTLI